MTRKSTKRKVYVPTSPIARAVAMQDFNALVLRCRIQAFMLEDGEDCTEFLSDIAKIVGSVVQAGMMHVGREPWVRTLHGTLRTLVDICKHSYVWRRDYALSMDRAIELAGENIRALPNSVLAEALQDAVSLSERIKRHEIQGNEVAGANGE